MRSVLYGFLMGTAELLPGISGSTVALMLGIYERFINVISEIIKIARSLIDVLRRRKTVTEVKEDFFNSDILFLIALGVGMILAFALLSGLVLHLFENYPHLIVSILLGLVLAALPIPLSEMNKDIKQYVVMLLIAGILWVLIGTQESTTARNIGPVYLFIAGLLGISGMVLPGLSGSFILLLLGVYYYVLGLAKQFFTLDVDPAWFFDTFSFALGLMIGFVTTVKVLKVSLEKYRSITMAVIAGLLLGSIRMLNPFVEGIGEGDDFHLVSLPISDFEINYIVIIVALIAISAISIGWINITRIRKGVFKETTS